MVTLAGKSFYMKVILHHEMREKWKKPDYLEKTQRRALRTDVQGRDLNPEHFTARRITDFH